MPESPDDAALSIALSIFKKHWGHADFRKAQRLVIEAALAGEDVLAVLPTSYGKTATFQVPALCRPGCAIVVSPLIALMKDQVDDCETRGIPASYINSHVDDDEMETRLSNFVSGAYKLFYIAPERLRSKTFMSALTTADVSFIVADEIHCASRWGHDFRPMYSRIKDLVKAVTEEDGTRPPIIGVTATATTEIEDDIAASAGMRPDYTRIIGDPIRPNLSYRILSDEYSEWASLKRCVRAFDTHNGRYIIYVGTRKGAEKVAENVRECLGLYGANDVGFYHAGMTKEDRIRVQNAFKGGKTPVIVATCAFGMGIDVPNIRAVVHFGIPGSLEDYLQEGGRAGRDGKHSEVILINSDYSVRLRKMFLDSANPPYELFESVWDWLNDTLAEREVLRLSGASIANRMAMDGYGPGDGHAVNTVLNTMEAHGLVRRAYMGSASVLRVNTMRLTDAIRGGLNGTTASLARALVEDLKGQSGRDVELVFDKKTMASTLKCKSLTLLRAVKALERIGAVSSERAYTGKTTQIRKGAYQVELDTLLPKDGIVQKRVREERRLQYMIAYIDAEDPIQYIRDYFLVKGSAKPLELTQC